MTTINPTSIYITLTSYNFGENDDPEDQRGIDYDASLTGLARQLGKRLGEYYPAADIAVETVSETRSQFCKISTDYPANTDLDTMRASDDQMEEVVDDLLNQIYNAGTFWQEGFNTEAWTEWLIGKISTADTGDIFHVTVVEADPMETQDALVEVVYLDPWTVAYRYSTHSYDDEWQVGTPEEAVERAKECYDIFQELLQLPPV